MGIFRKEPEPRSWNGETAAEQNGQSGDEKPYAPPQCTDTHHVSPVEYYRDETKGFKKMSCQSCGKNWTEKL